MSVCQATGIQVLRRSFVKNWVMSSCGAMEQMTLQGHLRSRILEADEYLTIDLKNRFTASLQYTRSCFSNKKPFCK